MLFVFVCMWALRLAVIFVSVWGDTLVVGTKVTMRQEMEKEFTINLRAIQENSKSPQK